ncbi:MAG: hypothetical protein ACJA04_000512 [Cellvibrionaceae bacterium]|jgi:hypothetical protein
MKDSKSILDQLEAKTLASPNNSKTPVGHRERGDSTSAASKSALLEAINECFELLRLNYQHLYFSAYPDKDAINSVKRLWLENLADFNPDIIRMAAHNLIKESDYLPTISRVIRHCLSLSSKTDLPNVHSAYIEACNATTPKQDYSWSHPAVYHVGQRCGWFFLSSNTEAVAYPIFKNHYEKLCEQLSRGMQLSPIDPLALPETTETPLSKAENANHMAKLRRELDI